MPEELKLAAILDDVKAAILRYIVLDDVYASTVALWIAYTHVFDVFGIAPYLLITSPEPESGKTRLLEIMSALVQGGWYIESPSGAALYIHIDSVGGHTTVLLDEYDTVFSRGADATELIRAVLNAGFQQGGNIPRAHTSYKVFCPKALAGLTKAALPDTVRSRSITIQMQRKLRGEKIDSYLYRDLPKLLGPLRLDLETVLNGMKGDLEGVRPSLPDELGDRAKDAWEPLFTVADAAGGVWAKVARDIAVEVFQSAPRSTETSTAMLLQDILELVHEKGWRKVATRALVDSLVGKPDTPWSVESGDAHYRKLETWRLSQMLRQHGLRSQRIRIDGTQLRGYDFTESTWWKVWERYCPDIYEVVRGELFQGEESVVDVTPVTLVTGSEEALLVAADVLPPSGDAQNNGVPVSLAEQSGSLT